MNQQSTTLRGGASIEEEGCVPKYNRRRVSVLLSSQTLYHLDQMAQFCGHKDLGRVIDKLVREKRLTINEGVRDNATSKYSNRRQNR